MAPRIECRKLRSTLGPIAKVFWFFSSEKNDFLESYSKFKRQPLAAGVAVVAACNK
jgi:hypothetical protein